jgi:hypothetical protein
MLAEITKLKIRKYFKKLDVALHAPDATNSPETYVSIGIQFGSPLLTPSGLLWHAAGTQKSPQGRPKHTRNNHQTHPPICLPMRRETKRVDGMGAIHWIQKTAGWGGKANTTNAKKMQ